METRIGQLKFQDGAPSDETVPGKGWFTILRLYSPMQAYFDKTWQAGEIELVK